MAPQTIAVLNGTSRTLVHLTRQALKAGDSVRAIVRSAQRFRAQVDAHKNLTVHEWSDFADVATLAEILHGVDVIHVALVPPAKDAMRPFRLNEDVVTSICSALRSRVQPGDRSRTTVILLGAYPARPEVRTPWFIESLLGNQYDDLRAAQTYLFKQKEWLDFVVVAAGLILDCEETEAKGVEDVELGSEGGKDPAPISYARLAGAMQLASRHGAKWNAKFVIPSPTSKVPWSFKHLVTVREMWATWFVRKVIPAVLPFVVVGGLGVGMGYVLGVREGGVWPLSRFGVDLRV